MSTCWRDKSIDENVQANARNEVSDEPVCSRRPYNQLLSDMPTKPLELALKVTVVVSTIVLLFAQRIGGKAASKKT